jgi:glucuronate isomerase
MKGFMKEDFLLSNVTAIRLYNEYASKMPIVDYHCHINPQEIAENKQYENITQVWLGEDHYKWRLMRSAGVAEYYITGAAPDREKFQKWAETLGKAIGNPLYHWSHLELQRYFNYSGILNGNTAEDVWHLCNNKLNKPSMSVRNLILRSNVSVICTTDDPSDSLEWHRKIASDPDFTVKVLPSWRPDKAMNIENADYLIYINKLEAITGLSINSFSQLKAALCMRMDHFEANGSKLSDHGLEFVMYKPVSKDEAEKIFEKRLSGIPVSKQEEFSFKTSFMLFVCEEYYRRNWVLQLHYGCKRDNNSSMFAKIGADTGYDCISNYTPSAQIADFLNALAITGQLPKTILYSLNPNDNPAIASIIGCFQDNSSVSKMQHGSAWWFNDHMSGMANHLTNLANLGYLPGYIGMLTDSRSFLSYPRHEYFRRILCNLLGKWVENGEFPADFNTLGAIVQDICYNNAVNYFNF